MAGKLESVMKEMFDALGRGDPEELIGHFSEEPQGIDELSRAWMRGRDALGEYIRGTSSQVSAPSSAVLRREGGGWRIVLFHSIPLPD